MTYEWTKRILKINFRGSGARVVGVLINSRDKPVSSVHNMDE